MTKDDLPPLPAHPYWHIGEDWSHKEILAIEAYALAAIAAHDAKLKEAQSVIRRCAAIMRGDGVEDQGEAWDLTLRALDAYIEREGA